MAAKLGILGSGEGSNMAAIDDSCRSGVLAAEVALVLSDVEDSGILKLAKERNISHAYIAPGQYRTKLDDSAESEFIRQLQAAAVDWVVLAGFMRIIKSNSLRAFPERIVNIHPSLLPSFPGLGAAAQAIEFGAKVTGATVHVVDQGIDTGAIIAQEAVRIEEGDTAQRLHERIKATEHRLYPQALNDLISGRIKICGRTTQRQA
ncbi:MAG: Phosphoribosylglycinamide formyltransferase [Verrucomicrobia subdivision 3 bacterium]|nr:Phosphoribosylglycinamide formyltransferase [Limisphaerales bacterium]MCS1413289.1 Phosphoribosylglycinamide formyltransferase [Limisphaerales bacterium]